MNQGLPNREQALKLLKEQGCPPQVIRHCLVVTDYAIFLAGKLRKRGLYVSLELVEAGAMLHDLGRSVTNGVNHSLVGAQIALTIGLPQPVINIIKRHVGAGITDAEAQQLGWPKDSYIPHTLEEKIVCYADKRIDQSRVVPIEVEIEVLRSDGMVEAAERVRRLHEEITNLLGEEL